ncbi:unnamed protein product [Ambrosiozyma monospora]|uniref:Unnamed protein product n=1 Tax=Ambrosiozyma monospora TaxID=43982 RepID=A0A9W6WGL1_AMBMO|nr:unnamed protein product [Ambrosiozyma monospora]
MANQFNDHSKRTPYTTPRHRTVFGNMSPNLMSNSRASIIDTQKVISPNFNVVSSDWSMSSKRFQMTVERSTTKSKIRESHSRHKSEDLRLAGSPKKLLRRTSTNEMLDRFIPSRQTTSGKLSLDDNTPMPYDLPLDHIESQTSEIYKNTVAQACGLEVGERILQFQPVAPEAKKIAKLKSNKFKNKQLISTSAAQARLKRIPTCPEKVLDAPGLIDDFYLNLLSWSSENVLAIALENAVYCWNATSGSVQLAAECDFINHGWP